MATLKLRWSRRLALLAALVVAVALPGLAFRSALARRDAYLARTVRDYQAPTGTHPFWHSIYIGFGFLANDKGLRYDDAVAFTRVAAIDPGALYVSPRYEAVARGMVADLIRSDPMFVIKSEAAKAGLLGFYFLVFANIGIAAALARRKPWRLDLALLGGIALAAVPALLVLPDFRYIFGFTTLSALFGLASLDAAVAAGWPASILRRPRSAGAGTRAGAEAAP